jgi:hypothetical protein
VAIDPVRAMSMLPVPRQSTTCYVVPSEERLMVIEYPCFQSCEDIGIGLSLDSTPNVSKSKSQYLFSLLIKAVVCSVLCSGNRLEDCGPIWFRHWSPLQSCKEVDVGKAMTLEYLENVIRCYSGVDVEKAEDSIERMRIICRILGRVRQAEYHPTRRYGRKGSGMMEEIIAHRMDQACLQYFRLLLEPAS